MADGWRLEAQYVRGICTEGQDRTTPLETRCRAHLAVEHMVFCCPLKLRINVLFPGQAIKIVIISLFSTLLADYQILFDLCFAQHRRSVLGMWVVLACKSDLEI